MKTPKNTKHTTKDRRWIFFNNGCIHGIQHSELVLLRRIPHRSLIRNTVAVFTISRTFGIIAALTVLVMLVLLLSSCALPQARKGGTSSTVIQRPGHTNVVTLSQSENPKESSRQSVQSEESIEYVVPPGSTIQLPTPASGMGGTCPTTEPCVATLHQPMPVRLTAKDRSETSIGAQKDTFQAWAAKAAEMRPVLWAGIGMMTLVAGLLAYFGWWTKAGLAFAIGLAMLVLAQTLPDHGNVILLAGLGLFALTALLVLYAYYKGQMDHNHNGIPDFLEKGRGASPS